MQPIKPFLPALFSLIVLLVAGCASGGAPETGTSSRTAGNGKDMESQHPAAYYKLAASLFKNAATKDEAVFWFYAGQLRYRYHLAANPGLPPSGDPALFASLSEVVGRPINEYAGADPDRWAAVIDEALKWDAAHDNSFTPKTKAPKAYHDIRAGLEKMRDTVKSTKAEILAARKKHGLN
jgi:hypothetical protein